MGLSSPNRIIWQYFGLLRDAIDRVQHAKDDSQRCIETALCILLSVAVVETFLNVYFRIVVEDKSYLPHKPLIQKGLEYPYASLDKKIKLWPFKVFGRAIDLNSGVGKDFILLKEKRNMLMHFTSSHETINIGNMTLRGTTNTDVIDNLTEDDAKRALDIAERFIAEIFILKGTRRDKVPHALHLWTGKLPI